MEAAFWDTSALVPLCVSEQGTALTHSLAAQYELVVWWATAVEARSAFSRLVRMQKLNSIGAFQAQRRLEMLEAGWREIQPTTGLRSLAVVLVDRYQLRAADALQLAAAAIWKGNTTNRPFLSGDQQLLAAAHSEGFRAIRT